MEDRKKGLCPTLPLPIRRFPFPSDVVYALIHLCMPEDSMPRRMGMMRRSPKIKSRKCPVELRSPGGRRDDGTVDLRALLDASKTAG